MIKIYLRPLIYLFFFLFVFIQADAQNWSSEKYGQYTFKTFERLEIVNQEINFASLDIELLNAAIFFETNRQRVKYNKSRFFHSEALEKAALQHSVDMVNRNFFSHTSKIKSRKKLSQRLAFGGLEKYYAAGENIAMTSSTSVSYIQLAKEIVDIWMKSSGHRANILDSSFKYLGCGAYFNKNNYVYATQTFSDINSENDIDYELLKLKK